MTNAFIVTLPLKSGEALHWWLIADGAVVSCGQDTNPVTAAGLEQAPPPEQVMALTPAAQTVIRWFAFPDTSERQGEAAARLKALDLSIGGGEGLHVAARHIGDGENVVTAIISKAVMVKGLAELQKIGLDPAIILPTSLAFPSPSKGFVTADVGGEQILRGPNIAMADDPPITRLLTEGETPRTAKPQEAENALIAAFEAPEINLRQGLFARNAQIRAVDARGWKILATLTAASFVLALVIMGIEWIKYENSIDKLEAQALAAAQTIIPEASDLTVAEQELDAKLFAKGAGSRGFISPVSALFSAMQSAPGVSARNMSYRADGILTVQLAAPRNEDINPILITLQAAGYKVTANPRQDSTGQAVADITVRGS